ASELAAGHLVFTPAANSNGTDYASFTFQLLPTRRSSDLDPSGAFTTQTFTIAVTAVNEAPAGTDKTVTTNEDTGYTFATGDFGFSDPSDSPTNTLLAVKISALPAAGTLKLNGVAVTAGDF